MRIWCDPRDLSGKPQGEVPCSQRGKEGLGELSLEIFLRGEAQLEWNSTDKGKGGGMRGPTQGWGVSPA